MDLVVLICLVIVQLVLLNLLRWEIEVVKVIKDILDGKDIQDTRVSKASKDIKEILLIGGILMNQHILLLLEHQLINNLKLTLATTKHIQLILVQQEVIIYRKS